MHRCVWNATADVRGKTWIASTASTAAATVLPTSAERDSDRTAETPPKTATPQSRAARQAPLDAVRVGIRKVAPTSRQRRQAMIISTMSSHQRSVEAGHIPGHPPLFQHASAAGTTSNRQHQFDHALLLRGASSLHRSSSGSRSGIEQSRMPEQGKLVVTCDDGEHLFSTVPFSTASNWNCHDTSSGQAWRPDARLSHSKSPSITIDRDPCQLDSSYTCHPPSALFSVSNLEYRWCSSATRPCDAVAPNSSPTFHLSQHRRSSEIWVC